MEEATFGLIGVVVGALVTGGVTWTLARRREQRDVRAAARLLRNDLLKAEGMLSHALNESRWWPRDRELPTSLWREERRYLAAELENFDDWEPIGRAFTELEELSLYVEVRSLEADLGALSVEYRPVSDDETVEGARELVRRGLARLDYVVGADRSRADT
jgi:hypothetical protein